MATPAEIEKLIARVARKDRHAFENLYFETSAKLFGICQRVLNNRAEAEDALPEIYIKVWHNAGKYNLSGLRPMTWLITIARNHAVDRLRAHRVRAADGNMDAGADFDDRGLGSEAMALQSAAAGPLASCLEGLAADRAEAVQLAYMRGETYADLSTRYAVPLNAMRSWLRPSLTELKTCLSR